MQSAAATIRRSPFHAPDTVAPNEESRATATPAIAIRTPAIFRVVNRSIDSIAPTSIVNNGKVDKASAPLAAVVYIRDALKRIGKSAKNKTPSPRTGSQSR